MGGGPYIFPEVGDYIGSMLINTCSWHTRTKLLLRKQHAIYHEICTVHTEYTVHSCIKTKTEYILYIYNKSSFIYIDEYFASWVVDYGASGLLVACWGIYQLYHIPF